MKELPILAILGIVFFLMIFSSIMRTREIRSDVESARTEQSRRVLVPPPDPSAFEKLKIASYGGNPSDMVFIDVTKAIRGTEQETGEFDEKPVREVILAPYWIDLKETTNQAYQKFIKMTDRHPQEIMVFYGDVSYLFEPTLPAVGVSWFDANDYCIWNGKRLPTEAEWEVAAGGNGLGRWPWGNDYIVGIANIREGEDGFAYTAPIGSYEAGRSPFGLYDASGNVSEWVLDWYDEFFYKEGQITLPQGPTEGSTKVVRGGSWDNVASDTRNTKRFPVSPYRKEATVGFRCAMDRPSSP
jgi:formylglycine-generating enzyme required for sulfatase activity